MGHKSRYSHDDLVNATRVINLLAYDASDANSTGWVAFGAKQDLYRLKWILESAINRCPDFGTMENDWLREHEKQKVWNILNEKTN